ncbi:ABC transporter ATP-binding protein [Paenibacillus melissococcoides]|uniref:ABC transporter ATP-binding protein n=1 Tax=Paenibacillus melissococcoides TaxID=2912268 RepID=A0ABN8U0T0_9BACL|nr:MULTISPECIES: ABC transporter ATP-binding protein [Paenibacillus]GIO77400.1 polyamine ABC transporter ATP-binding protein [Paenibacillus dendritiformis]CAH8244656.1 ABC transporter ATP-binding protein [Paenibacillus melissococcoides]CAH8708621.1 ABC transporter ATP-binding protein [Paenibacillus melissococcoides]CAH8709338.1 ABC transporter ATP-binding protein [Paenibacillus melissococcoides]
MAKSVTLQQVSKAYADGQGNTSYAVSDIHLEIEAGQFVTLLGPSGCGKTTTLRMIAGFEEITSGSIYFGDELVNPIPPNKRDCTMVFQSYALFPHLNMFDNVAYGLRIKKMSKDQIRSKVDSVLDIMNLREYKDRMPSQLSGGQQQRVALARALVMEPGVLLFDEPLSNLDAKLRLVMRDEIRRIQQQIGITAIYVTHDQSEAMSMSDQIIVMNKGKIEQVGSPVEIYQRPKTKFVADFIGTANFIEGTVKSVEDGHMTVATASGDLRVRRTKHKPQDRVTVVIRPEAVSLAEAGASHVGTVVKSVFMGQTQEYEVEYEGQTLQITEHNPILDHVFRAGDFVSLRFAEQSLHVI